MKYQRIIYISALVLMTCVSASALNLMNYATQPGGEMDYILFPERNGCVYLCDTIPTTLDKEDVLDAVDSYLMTIKSYPRAELNNMTSSRRRISADVELGFGQRDINFEVWGHTVANIATDASKLKFNISVLAKDSMAIVTYSNFETNRTYISGEPKNDGDPNIIQWQRVNALKNQLQELNPDNDKDLEEIYDLEQLIRFQHFLYANEANEFHTIVEDMRKVIKDDSDAAYQPVAVMAINEKPKNYQEIDIAKYKGCLLAKDNNVYVTSGSVDYERSGAGEIMRRLRMDKFWNIVPEARYAHFIIEYHVNTEGRDKAYIIIKDGNGNNLVNDFPGSKTGSSESVSENKEVAYHIYKKALRKLQEQVSENELPSQFSAYFRN